MFFQFAIMKIHSDRIQVKMNPIHLEDELNSDVTGLIGFEIFIINAIHRIEALCRSKKDER